MPTWTRWTLYDPNLDVTLTFPMNPSEGGERDYEKSFGYTSTVAPDGDPVFFEGQGKPGEIDFKGTFLSFADRDTMVFWYDKSTQLLLTRDYGSQDWIYITKLTQLRKRVVNREFKAEYSIHAFILDIPT